MAKPHKYASAAATVHTSLSPEAAEAIVRRVLDSLSSFHVAGTGDGFLRVAIKSWAKVTQMTFDVNLRATPEGTVVATEIVDYLTQQSKVFIFIPIGPKTMIAWKPYRQFMATLTEGFKAADPGARATIVETVPTA